MSTVVYSVIVPLFNEEDVVLETYQRLKAVMDSTNEAYELVFVNDASKDTTSKIVRDICRLDRNIKLIEFSRNYGQQIAVTAGLDYCLGNAIVVMDADLQDPPEVIPKMIKKWKEGYHVVYGKRIGRKWESISKRYATFIFYRLIHKLTTIDMPVDVGDFRLIDRKICNLIKTMRERNRYFRGLVTWLGFRTTSVEYRRDARFAGATNYSNWKLMKLGFDGIISFSFKPLKLPYYLGILMIVINLFYLLFSRSLSLPIFAVNSILNGIGLLTIGILGEYVGRIYDEVKGRPLYTVECTSNITNSNNELENISQSRKLV